VDTEFRQYAFKWYQGMTHGNTVVAHFGDVDRKCTFCKITLEREMAQRLGRDITIAERARIAVPDEDRPLPNSSQLYTGSVSEVLEN
jgi:hypothetical protein